MHKLAVVCDNYIGSRGFMGKLYLIGLGLGDPRDITLRGLEAVKSCTRLFIDYYTSIFSEVSGTEPIEEAYNVKNVVKAYRDICQGENNPIIAAASEENAIVGFLVVGDPLCATTHMDLILQAKKRGIQVEVCHNSSVLTAIGITGLQLYRFGEVVSIPYWTSSWKPESFYEKIVANKTAGLHTLCLLDIRMRERTLRGLTYDVDDFEPPRFMSVKEGLEQLKSIDEARKSSSAGSISGSLFESNGRGQILIGVARLGSADQSIVSGTYEELVSEQACQLLGGPLHSLVIPGNMCPVEEEYVITCSINAFG